MNLNSTQIDLISHSLGINYYHAVSSKNKRDKVLPKEFYRNYFNYDTLDNNIIELESAGYIEYFNQYNNNYFGVTDKGIEAFKEIFQKEVTDKYVPLSKSKERYLDFLDADCGSTYEEYIGVRVPKREYKDGLVRLINTKNGSIKSDFMPTLKEAKISYKFKLKVAKSK